MCLNIMILPCGSVVNDRDGVWRQVPNIIRKVKKTFFRKVFLKILPNFVVVAGLLLLV